MVNIEHDCQEAGMEAGLTTEHVGYSVAIANNMAEAFLSCFIPQGYLD